MTQMNMFSIKNGDYIIVSNINKLMKEGTNFL